MARAQLPALHLITDTTIQSRFSHYHLAAQVLAAGVRLIQYRQKTGSTRQMVEEARALATLCRQHGALLIINDRLDVALAAEAHGLHLGQDDLPLSVARAYLGTDKILGCSANTVALARQAAAEGADYVGFGPIFPTSSKADASAVKGLGALREFCQALSLPVVALGGVDESNIQAVLQAGASAVAVIGAVCSSPSPDLAAARLLQRLAGNF